MLALALLIVVLLAGCGGENADMPDYPMVTEPSGEAKLVLQAEPADITGYEIRFIGEVVGGPNNNQDLYCTKTRWDFGDGLWAETLYDCPDWTPQVSIIRSFRHTYTYKSPGVYTVTFPKGSLEVSLMIEVPR